MTDDSGNSANATINLKMQESFPDLSVLKPEVNVFGGVEVRISGNKLQIGGEDVASWSDKVAEPCTATLSLGGQEVNDGDILSEPGRLTVTVTNSQERSSSAEIILTNDAVYGLESLKDLPMQVDEEIDLLAAITLANGADIVKVEIEMDGERTVISDPSHFIPQYPGTCSLIFTVKGKDGRTTECKAENLTIKPLEYKEISISTANMIQEKYSWYNNLQWSTKNFIYPHLLASYAACNWSRQDNRVHIIMGETADTDDIENI